MVVVLPDARFTALPFYLHSAALSLIAVATVVVFLFHCRALLAY